MLRDSLHSSGASRSLETPWPVGPRNCGQSCARAAGVSSKTASATLAAIDRTVGRGRRDRPAALIEI
jgi:hypothetical protein